MPSLTISTSVHSESALTHLTPDTMESTRDLVCTGVEFSTGMNFRENDFDGRPSVNRWILMLHGIDRHASAIVGHRAGAIDSDRHIDQLCKSCHDLINGVVDCFVDEVMQCAGADAADVHARPFSNRFKSFKNLD